jgi:hypothetical protein
VSAFRTHLQTVDLLLQIQEKVETLEGYEENTEKHR